MAEEIYDYEVRCSKCLSTFKVQLFDSHEKNLFVVDKKEWYCKKCKDDYFDNQTKTLFEKHKTLGFTELNGTQKTISWAEKIRGEMLNKLKYYKESLSFQNDDLKILSDKTIDLFLKEWQKESEAKWWIDHRRMNVRDISSRLKEIEEDITKEEK